MSNHRISKDILHISLFSFSKISSIKGGSTRVILLQSRAKTDQNWPNNLQVVEGVAGEKNFLI